MEVLSLDPTPQVRQASFSGRLYYVQHRTTKDQRSLEERESLDPRCPGAEERLAVIEERCDRENRQSFDPHSGRDYRPKWATTLLK